jgi:hypothetical protein
MPLLRSIAAFAFVSAIAVLSAPGCSQQGEGQRCDSVANGDADCDDGLVCIKQKELLNGLADVCCHPDPANDSESRCQRGGTTIPGGGGSGGTSSAGTSAGGAAGEQTDGGTAGADAAGGGTPGASGSPAVSDGGMSGGGAPVVTEGGAAGAGTAGQGGAG